MIHKRLCSCEFLFVGPSTKFVSVIYLGGFWSRAPARSLFLRWFWTSIAFPAVKFRRSSLLPVRIVGSYLFWQLRKLGKSCENKRMLNFIKKYLRVPNETEGMLFCYQNCSDLLWEKNVLVIEAEGWEFAKILRSLEQFIQTVEGQNRMLY